jgi:hypothetical protein
MQYHEAVISLIVVGYDTNEVRPQPWCHVGRIDGRGKLMNIDVGRNLLELWHLL